MLHLLVVILPTTRSVASVPLLVQHLRWLNRMLSVPSLRDLVLPCVELLLSLLLPCSYAPALPHRLATRVATPRMASKVRAARQESLPATNRCVQS